MTEKTPPNRTYKKLAVHRLHKLLCFVLSLVVVDSFRLRKRQLLVGKTLYVKYCLQKFMLN